MKIIKVDFSKRAKDLRSLHKNRKKEKKWQKIELRIIENIRRYSR